MSIITDSVHCYKMSRKDAEEFLTLLTPKGYVDICQFHAGNVLHRYRKHCCKPLNRFHCVREPDFKLLGLVLNQLTGKHVAFDKIDQGFKVIVCDPTIIDYTGILDRWFDTQLTTT